MLVYPSSIDLSSRTLRFLTGQLTARRREIGTRWRRLPAARQALLALAHLRCGDTYAQLAAGFGIGIATAFRYIREAVDILATLAPSLAEAMNAIRAKAFVILDGTLLPIDRIAADTPYYSGKHKRHGMNIQVLTDPFGRLLWPRPRCPAPLTTSPPRDSTGSSKPSLKRDSNAGLTRRIKVPAEPSESRFGAAVSSDGSAATTPPTPRSAASASRPWPPSRAGGSCGSSAAAPTTSPTW
ncbi:DDE superfamily endonuclease [Streptomyces sp. TLI_55]|nr:DDE superfamily endonuclease [Streptomyces sp. TLI_55]